MAPEFVPALELNAGFYADVVEPLVRAWPHSAALLGWGSEILGLDTERSTDHGWGPRLQLFVDLDHFWPARAALDAGLPAEYRGWPVAFGWDEVASTHHVEVVPLGNWLFNQLGCDPRTATTYADWLTMPQQKLLGVTRGAVFHDATGELAAVRDRLRYFPDELRLWLLACQWRRLDQEEPFVGRTAEVGDEAGSRVLAARLVRDLMRVHFLLAGEYWPYSKWFGSAYRKLPHSAELLPAFEAALVAPDYATREDALVAAYEHVARLHNDSGLTEPLDPTVSFFHDRPFRVLGSHRFVEACLRAVDDEWLRSLPLVGSIDQFADSTDVLQNIVSTRTLRAIYGDAIGAGAS